MIEFRYPYILLLSLFLILYLIIRYIFFDKQKNEFSKWIDDRLKKKIFIKLNTNKIKLKNNLRIIAILFLIFSASGPQIGKGLKKVERKGIDVLFALDISSSMLAQDIKPSRLEKAKFEINKMIRSMNGDRIGLIIFSGSAHLYLPFTTDYDAANLFINSVDTDMIRTNGTSISDAIAISKESFYQTDNNKVLILISDGEDHEGEALALAKELKNNNIIIHCVGIGTREGSLIPVYDENSNFLNYKKDMNDKLVTSSLNEKVLMQIARITGGNFYRIDNINSKINDLSKKINIMKKNTLNTHEYAQFIDRYQFFLILSIILFAIDFLTPTLNNRKN